MATDTEGVSPSPASKLAVNLQYYYRLDIIIVFQAEPGRSR